MLIVKKKGFRTKLIQTRQKKYNVYQYKDDTEPIIRQNLTIGNSIWNVKQYTYGRLQTEEKKLFC